MSFRVLPLFLDMPAKGRAASTRAEKDERGSWGRIFGGGREEGTVSGGGSVVVLRFFEGLVPSSRPARGGR